MSSSGCSAGVTNACAAGDITHIALANKKIKYPEFCVGYIDET